MNDQLEDDMLLKDVQDFVNYKLKNITSVNDIPVSDFKIKEEIYKNDADLYNQLYHFKKVLQITINTYKSFSNYTDYCVKFFLEEKDKKIPLKDYYKYDNDGDVWRCISQPLNIHLVDALYNYIHCFLLIERKDKGNYKEKNDVHKCTVCNKAISQGKEKCDICETAVNRIEIHPEKVNYIPQVVEYFNIYADKWKCGQCGCANDYTLINCIACCGLFQEGLWICGGCTFENSCTADRCKMCKLQNVSIKTVNEINDNRDLIESEKDKNALKKKTEVKIITKHWKCGICDSDNEYGVDSCRLCNGKYTDWKWKCGKCLEQNSCLNNICKVCGQKNDNVGIIICEKCGISINGNDKHCDKCKRVKKESEMMIWKEKWKCSKCECANEYRLLDCMACGGIYKEGKWLCGECMLENDCINERCEKCNERNVNLEKKNKSKEDNLTCGMCTMYLKNGDIEYCYECQGKKKTAEVKEIKDRWKCRRCGILYLYDLTVCCACNGSRIENGVWQCGQCTLVNNCRDVMCGGCNITNNYLLVKYCGYCKRNRVNMKEELCYQCESKKWKCAFTHCGERNLLSNVYCYKCGIYRHSPTYRGGSIKLYDRERYMWICYKCHQYNEQDNNVCKCGESRYSKGWYY